MFREGMHQVILAIKKNILNDSYFTQKFVKILQNRHTYTPRMILYDLKDNINVFRTAGSKEEQERTDAPNIYTWSGGETQVFAEQTNQTSEFIADLEKVLIFNLFDTL